MRWSRHVTLSQSPFVQFILTWHWKLIILQVCVAQFRRNLVQNVHQSYSSGGYKIVFPHPTLWHSPSNGNDDDFPFQRWDVDLFPGGYLLLQQLHNGYRGLHLFVDVFLRNAIRAGHAWVEDCSGQLHQIAKCFYVSRGSKSRNENIFCYPLQKKWTQIYTHGILSSLIT